MAWRRSAQYVQSMWPWAKVDLQQNGGLSVRVSPSFVLAATFELRPSFVSLPAAMNASAAAASSALGIGSWSIATPLEVGSGWNVCVMAETGDESSEAETSGTGGRHVEDVVGFVEVLAFFGIGLFGAVAPIFRTVLGCILLKYDFLACR